MLALAVVGCAPDAAREVAIDCGPLPATQCEERTEIALEYLAESYPNAAARRVEFIDIAGTYLVTFADGTQVAVSP